MRSQQEVNAIIRQLCSGLKPLFPQGSMEAILFGSYARGEADADSDIDVMVLVDSSRQDISEKTWEISSVAADLLLDRGVMVSPIVENRRYFQDNMGFLPFYQNIAHEGVKIYSRKLRQHRTIRLRHLSEKSRSDFVTFSCNTQSIPAKNCLHQNPIFLEICSCRIMRCRLRNLLRSSPSARSVHGQHRFGPVVSSASD